MLHLAVAAAANTTDSTNNNGRYISNRAERVLTSCVRIGLLFEKGWTVRYDTRKITTKRVDVRCTICGLPTIIKAIVRLL